MVPKILIINELYFVIPKESLSLRGSKDSFGMTMTRQYKIPTEGQKQNPKQVIVKNNYCNLSFQTVIFAANSLKI
jgi:hypothetical protein